MEGKGLSGLIEKTIEKTVVEKPTVIEKTIIQEHFSGICALIPKKNSSREYSKALPKSTQNRLYISGKNSIWHQMLSRLIRKPFAETVY